MVSNKLSEKDVIERAATLSFPNSVVEYLEGRLGQPPYGFPEPLRSTILKSRGIKPIEGRPGKNMPPIDMVKLKKELEQEFGKETIRDVDVISSALYPQVFKEFRQQLEKYGDLSILESRFFLSPLEIGQEAVIDLEEGKTLICKLLAVGPIDIKTGKRDVFFELNGESRCVKIKDDTAANETSHREIADPTDAGQVGAPMGGVVVELRVKAGIEVQAGDPLCVLSAMKMETVVTSTVSGKVEKVTVKQSDSISAGDLICRIIKNVE